MHSEPTTRPRFLARLGPRTARLFWPRNPYLRGLVWTAAISLACILFVDRPLGLYFYGQREHWVHAFFRAITEIGNGAGWFALGVLAAAFGFGGSRLGGDLARVLAWRRIRNFGLFLLASLIVSGVALIALKVLFGRLRPRYLFESGSYGFQPFTFDTGMVGFPSGHTQTIFAAMTVLWLTLPRLRPLWLAVAVLVAFSRVVVGAHYLGDIVAGAFLAVALTVMTYDRLLRAGLPPRLQRRGFFLPPALLLLFRRR